MELFARCPLPVRIEGPVSFTLMGVWTWPVPTYLRALMSGLEAHSAIDGPRVIAGDFNGSVRFDKPRSRLKRETLFEQLGQQWLVSGYHDGRHELGCEPDATQFHRRNPQEPFHIDYCFVPRASTIANAFVESSPALAELLVVDVEPR